MYSVALVDNFMLYLLYFHIGYVGVTQLNGIF